MVIIINVTSHALKVARAARTMCEVSMAGSVAVCRQCGGGGVEQEKDGKMEER